MVHLVHLNPDVGVLGPRERILERIKDRAFLDCAPPAYPGTMTICKPQRKHAFPRDPFNGWQAIAAGGLEIIELASGPGGTFVEPYVQTLAQKLKQQIDQAVSNNAEISD